MDGQDSAVTIIMYSHVTQWLAAVYDMYCYSELSFPWAGYSPGNMPLAGYLPNNEGGECFDGYKMAMNIQSLGDH